MKRRNFINQIGGSIAATGILAHTTIANDTTANINSNSEKILDGDFRPLFPRLKEEIYLNAAGMMPLSSFSQNAINQYLKFQSLGYSKGGQYVDKALGKIKPLFADLIGAKENEIGLVHCTKAGEQIALNAADDIKVNGNIVTNDLHFSGSLHNLIGQKKAGRDVRIIRADNWKINIEKMKAAIDKNTAIVAVSLVSNINGHIEDIKALSKIAHKQGALVYADIIQAAGIIPVNVHEMGIDIAACSCYKWLYGVHGTGFLFINENHQGTQIKDHLFPGHLRYNYQPWVDEVNRTQVDFIYRAPDNASRYQPGHVNYLGYCAAYEGLKFIKETGVENILAHSIYLNQLLKSKLDSLRFKCISTHLNRSPIITFRTLPENDIKAKLKKAKITVSFGQNRLRISPGIYNNESDIEALIEVISG